MFTNRKNFFIALSTAIFIFVGLIIFAVPANSQTGQNLITSFTNGTLYPYDAGAPNYEKTLTTSGNNISSAIETRKNFGGTASNLLKLDTTKSYTLTYTYTPNPINPGAVPNIRLVIGRDGRSDTNSTTTPKRPSGLNIVAQSGTHSYTFTPALWSGYLEVSVGNNVTTNFSMTNIGLSLTPSPPVVVSHSTTFNLTVESLAKTAPAPTNVVVKQGPCNGTDASLEISWDKIPSATDYKLYRTPATPATIASPVSVDQPISGTRVIFVDEGLASEGLYSYEISAMYGNEEGVNKSGLVSNFTRECLPTGSFVSLSCVGPSGCIAEYDGSVDLTPVGSGWNSCTPSSGPAHGTVSPATGWDGASWLVNTGPTSGLVAHYKFDEKTGSTASDSSGENNTGTLYNYNSPTWWTMGKLNGALSFDGVNDYVETKDFSFSKNDSFTFSVWAKTSAFAASQVIFGKPHPNWEYSLMTSPNGANAVRFVYWNSTGSRGAIEMNSPSNSFPNNTWTHFIISYDGSAKVAKMYVNGIEKASNSGVSDTFQNRTNNLWIGAGYYGGAQRYFNGSIDDVRIYNKALSETEVQALYYNNFSASGIDGKYAAGSLDKNKYTFTFSCEKDGGPSDFEEAYVCVKPPIVQIFSATAMSPTSIKVEWGRPSVNSSFVFNYILNGETIPCDSAQCSKTYEGLTPDTPYPYQLITSTPNLCGGEVLESSPINTSVRTPPEEVVSGFNLSATPSTIKISAIGSTGGSDLISTPSTIKVTPNSGFDKDVTLSLLSVSKVEINGSLTPVTDSALAKFVTTFIPNDNKIKYTDYKNGLTQIGSKLTITSKKGTGNRIPTGKYILTIKGVGGVIIATKTIVLNVGILSFDYREY